MEAENAKKQRVAPPPPPPPPPRAGTATEARKPRSRKERGFSLVGVMAASAVGLIVIYGTTSFMVQMKQQHSSLEKEVRRLHADSYFNKIISNAFACRNSLRGHYLPPAASGSTVRTMPLKGLRDSNDDEVLSFGPSGWAPNARTKKKLKEMGLDDFRVMEFVYDESRPNQAEIHVHTHPDKGVFREPLRFNLTDVAVSGNFVTSCNGPSNPCGPKVSGSQHPNGGGFKADTATVHAQAYIGPNAGVCDTARLGRRVQVKNLAKVSGSAEIGLHPSSNGVTIKDSGHVRGGEIYQGAISDNAYVKDVTDIYDSVDLRVSEDAQMENARLYQGAAASNLIVVRGGAEVTGGKIRPPVTISGGVISDGDIGLQHYGQSVTYISGGKISGGVIGHYGDSRIDIDGGEISGGLIFGYDSTSRITISGGEISGGRIEAVGAGVSTQIEGGEITGGKIVNSIVRDSAEISGNPSNPLVKWAIVEKNAKISGNAQLEGTAHASDGLTVTDSAEISGGDIKNKVKIKGRATVYGGLIKDNAEISGHVKVCNVRLPSAATTQISGATKISGAGPVCGTFTGGTRTAGNPGSPLCSHECP